jgi:predicted DNA-binding protein
MPKAKTDKEKVPTIQTAIRLDRDLIERLDAVADKLSRPGLAVTRSDAMRICLMTGLEAIEKER